MQSKNCFHASELTDDRLRWSSEVSSSDSRCAAQTAQSVKSKSHDVEPANRGRLFSRTECARPRARFSMQSIGRRGTKRIAARSKCMASRPRQQCINHLGTAFAIHIGAYCGVAGCLVLVLIFLHQPYRSSNPGLAAYKPPPGTAIQHYLLPSRPESRGVLVVLPAAPATELETTGRSLEQPDVRQDAQATPEPERRPNTALTRKPKAPKELRRDAAAQTSVPQPAPCIPGYDGSGAQTRWC
jgi:hypothetical protein